MLRNLFKKKPSKTILSRAEHNVSRKDIDPDALSVLYRLNRSGYTACLVGGAVRDLLLGRKPKDFDVCTTAHPNKVRRLFGNCFLIGRRFRLAHIKFGDKVIECSTFRKKPEPVDATNDEETSLYMRHDNTFGTPREDAERRDFTINGLFYDIESFQIIDYVGGCEDLKRRLIRTIGDPDVRFLEDPVRMLRAIRFAARLGFEIERRTWKSLLRHHAEILKSSPARLFEELTKLFVYGTGAQSMRLMKSSGLLDDLMPGVSGYLSGSKDKGRLFWRMLDALDRYNAEQKAPSVSLIYGALAYPVFAEEAEVIRRERNFSRKPLAVAMDIIRSISPGLPMPQAILFQAAHMIVAQRYFEGWDTERFSKQSFVRQKSFQEAALLYDLLLSATDRQPQAVKPWMNLSPEPEAAEHGGRRSKRSRRRRHPGRMGRRREAGGQESKEEHRP